MDLQLVLSFIGTSMLLSLMPGPDNLFVLTQSVTKGQQTGMAISVGLCLGVLIHTLAAATGLSLIIQHSAMAFSLVKYAGAAYLFYLAYGALKEQQPAIELQEGITEETANIPYLIKKGFLMNVLNPKVSLFFIAFLPRFITYNGMNVTIQMIILGLLFMLQALLVFSLIAVLSCRLTTHIYNPGFWKGAKWINVTVLSLLGLTLAFSKK
ncbi:MAG: LysE family translocator [Cytophagales bacterium]|nr:LysE family translocator [Cytophaga sp.]